MAEKVLGHWPSVEDVHREWHMKQEEKCRKEGRTCRECDKDFCFRWEPNSTLEEAKQNGH